MKKNLAVIFGGRSSEHEVSCVSVVTIAKAVDLEKYNMFLIGITKDGEWKLVDSGENVADGSLGDQFFVKAEVVDDNFVVTMTDGTVHTLPIVADLACAIDKTDITLDAEGFWVIEKGARVEVPVKIIGENPQVCRK